ncbi:hypothetical protein Tco_0661265 [Tanacetum coccineum]
MDANKKMDLDNPLCPNESKILANILHNHALRFSIAASSSVPWIYLGQLWHTLKEDRSKYRLSFMIALLTPTSINIDSLSQIHKAYRKNKDGVGMNIPNWMITNEMKLTEHYRMYAAMFGVDVPTTQSQPIESTQGMHRTTSAPRRSTRLTPPTPIPTTVEADDIIQLSIAEQKSRDELESKKMYKKLEPRSNKESPKVEITDVEQLINVIEEEEESAEDDYELRRREIRGEWAHKRIWKRLLQMQYNKKARIFGHIFLHKLTMLSLTIFLLRPSAISPRDQDDPHDDAHLEGENSVKRQKMTEHETYVFGESSFGQANKSKSGPSMSGMQESNISFTQIHKPISVIPKLSKTIQSILALSLVNQDLLYLKKGIGPEKIVMSLHKFPAVIFLDDDIEERTSRWVDKCVKKFNPYA